MGLVFLSASVLLACKTQKSPVFAGYDWQVDKTTGEIVGDGSLRFAAGAQPAAGAEIIGDSRAAEAHKGLDSYLRDICGSFDIAVDTILFYMPEQGLLCATFSELAPPLKPMSVTTPVYDDNRPFTAWVRPDDTERWDRKDNEMYTNIALRKRDKQLLRLDRLTYRGHDIALIHIFQQDTKKFREMGFSEDAAHWADPSTLSSLEIAGDFLDRGRETSFANLLKGMVSALEGTETDYMELIGKADSCFMANNPAGACGYFERAFRLSRFIRGSHLSNAAEANALSGNPVRAVDLLCRRMRTESRWYTDLGEKEVFRALHGDPRWGELVDSMTARKRRIEAGYDLRLKATLEDVARTDQEVRYRYINALNAPKPDSAEIARIGNEILATDAKNLATVTGILDKYGWVGSDKVGEATSAIWLVIQHSNLEVQKKYFPLMEEAARKGDIPKSFVALTDDRINVNEGKPQKYGSQLKKDRTGHHRPFPLLDESRVDEWRKEVGLEPLEDYLKAMDRQM